MKYKIITQIDVEYNDEEFTKEDWEEIKKSWNQEYIENGTKIKMSILCIEKDS